MIWEGSRGFSGKSTNLSGLGFVGPVFLGAAVTILGGSGEQSQRVHETTSQIWTNERAPRHLLLSDPTAKRIRLTNGGRVTPLMASQRSARGPHPNWLLLDEVDEMALSIFKASLGQPMEYNGVHTQIVLSSTHQYADGTMTEVIKLGAERGWPHYKWCYREGMASLYRWLTQRMIDEKKSVIPDTMWETEYELQEPNPEDRAIVPAMVDLMFDASLGVFRPMRGEFLQFENPVRQEGVQYATGIDWGRRRHRTIVWTWRTDCRPFRLVAYRWCNRLEWPVIIDMARQQCIQYPGPVVHDMTGIGDVVGDYFLGPDIEGLWLEGHVRQQLFSDYINAIEKQRVKAPRVIDAYDEHRLCSLGDLYTSSGHPPDSIIGGALGYYAATHPKSRMWSRQC